MAPRTREYVPTIKKQDINHPSHFVVKVDADIEEVDNDRYLDDRKVG